MAARLKSYAVKERKAPVRPVKPLTLKGKRRIMSALRSIEAQVEKMDTQIRDLKAITKSFSFWIIG